MYRFLCQFRDHGKDHFVTDSGFAERERAEDHVERIVTALYPRTQEGQVYDAELQRVIYPAQGRINIVALLEELQKIETGRQTIMEKCGIPLPDQYDLTSGAETDLLTLIRAICDGAELLARPYVARDQWGTWWLRARFQISQPFIVFTLHAPIPD